MKKVLFFLVATGLFATTLISCQSNQKVTTEAGADSTQITVVEDSAKAAAVAATTNGSEILSVSPDEKLVTPQFSNEDVNNGFAKFEPLKQEYMAAINAYDPAKVKDVTARYFTWVQDAATWGSKLTKDENQIYIDHYTKLVTQWDKLSLKLKK